MALRKVVAALGAAALVIAAAAPAAADEAETLAWTQTIARGLFKLCLADAPDAAVVAEHGEVWGWPRFMGYLEHPDGYRREAGGESRMTRQDGDLSAYVEATIQSGVVTTAKPDPVRYFRCNMASDQKVAGDLAAYFTDLYGAPASKTDAATVWLDGAAKGAATDSDNDALNAVEAGGADARGMRIELTHENGLDRAKLTLFQKAPPAG
jgi:hypothetical protein